MKLLIFATAAYNLAETSRMIEIAKEAKTYFHIKFLTYGGRFEHLIDESGFDRIKMKPELTDEKLKYLTKVLNGDTYNTLAYFTKDEIDQRVKSEIEVFNRYHPVAVVTGWNLTVGISTRATKIPFVNVLHSTTISEYYKAGLQSLPDNIDFKLLNRLISKERRTSLFNKRVLNASFPIKPYNAIAIKYDLVPFKNFIEYIEGDKVFLADIPELVNLNHLREHLHFIGPLPARLNIPVPAELNHLSTDKPIIYFAMGSSGKPQLVKNIIEGFRNKPYTVIAPIAPLVKHLSIDVPDNVIVTGFIPADKVNALADIAVIHGGQNTVMTACLSKTPFVGIGMHAEQQANIDACVRKGFAIRLSKKYVTAEDIITAIERLVTDKEAKIKIEKFQEQLSKWDGPKNAALLLNKFYG